MRPYHYVIVGAGLFGAVFAYEAARKGKKCLVVDRRPHVGGNAYTETVEGIQVHRYGAHIFHTNDQTVWRFIKRFAAFNRYTNAPLARYQNEIYNLPFNMNTFYRLWGVTTPAEAKQIINSQQIPCAAPDNLEQQALALVGTDVYEKLIKHYTEKQWGRRCADLPAFIIKRLPVRFTWDNNYFNDRYQGIPEGGYTPIMTQLLQYADVKLNTDFMTHRDALTAQAEQILYTGMLDEYYNYRFGALAYRSLRFETAVLDTDNFQGNAVVNYTDGETPFTRIIEHKHFEFGTQPKTVISYEYPKEFAVGDEPFYPINDEENERRFAQYKSLANQESRTLFGGRLADYRYYDMWQVVKNAMDLASAYV